MSRFIAGAITAAKVVGGLLASTSTQIRKFVRRNRRPMTIPSGSMSGTAPGDAPTERARSTEDSSLTRAAAYREILDALGDELDDDIAEWEAVLQEFPQVIGASDLNLTKEHTSESSTKSSDVNPVEPAPSESELATPLHRARRPVNEEVEMIRRLLKTGFAPEEIALWWNLPLERVQEIQIRSGLT